MNKKKLQKEILRIPEERLADNGKYVQHFCINEGNRHIMPLKDKNGCASEKENWNLSEMTLLRVNVALRKLNEYADKITKLFSEDKDTALGCFILPPWLVFPLYEENDENWLKNKNAGIYDILYSAFIYRLTDVERKIYFQKYPVPEYIEGRYQGGMPY